MPPTPWPDSGPAVFLDRDGVLTEPVWDPVDEAHESPARADQVALVAGAAEGVRMLVDAGWPIVVVSNQPGAAKGKTTVEELERVRQKTVRLLAAEGVAIAEWRTCVHHPRGVVPDLTGSCDCRKPAPGMLVAAAAELGIDLAGSWMVGDSDGDVGAGRAAGTRTILIEHPLSAHRRSPEAVADARVRDLREAAALIGSR